MAMPQCGICYCDFSIEDGEHTPKSLNCAHSVCTGCARQMLKNGLIVCPVCRKLTLVQGNNVANLHKNFSLIEAINMMRTLLKKEEKSDKCPPKCVEHPYNLAEFVCIESNCLSVDKLMCRTCEEFGTHQGHTKGLLISKAAEFRETLKSRLKQMELNKQNFKLDTDVIRRAVIDNEKLLNSKLKNIKDHFDQIRQLADEKEKELVNDLTTNAKKIREHNNTTKNNLICWQKLIVDYREKTEKRMNMNDFDLYTAGIEIEDNTWYYTPLGNFPPADTKDMEIKLPTFKFDFISTRSYKTGLPPSLRPPRKTGLPPSLRPPKKTGLPPSLRPSYQGDSNPPI